MQQVLAVRRKFHKHFTTIIVSVPTSQRTVLNKTIDKLHSAVMAKAELLRAWLLWDGRPWANP
jgi:hypothetical protein